MFGINKYANLLDKLREEGVIFSKDWDEEYKSATILLRHDIDFSVDRAYELALLEIEKNVFSTFFFMLTSNMYNLLSFRNKNLVNEILKMGHKISLHFDPTVYDSIEPLDEERKIFEDTFKVEIDIISIHRPGKFIENNKQKLLGLNHTYQDKYFKEMLYVSDSGGKSIDKSVSNYIKNKENKILHLLLHPIWWTDESESPTSTLESWRNQNSEILISEIRKNCKTYTK